MTTTPPDIPNDDQNPEDENMVPQRNDGNNPRASWQISTQNLQRNLAHCKAENKKVMIDCFLWCINKDITIDEFASAVKSSRNTLYKIITGRYTDPQSKERLDLSVKLVNNMKRWLKEQRHQLSLQSSYIETPTAKKVFTACRLAYESRTPVMIFGPSHIGKTWALERFSEQNNHGRTIYVRLGAASGLGGMLSEIARSIGVSGNSSKEKMIKFIKGALEPDMLLILDEVHELLHTYRKESFFACIEVLREFYDRVGCGMILCFTRIKWDEVNKHRKSDLEQMFRRGVHKYALGTKSGQPLLKDIEMILNHYKLGMPKKEDEIIIGDILEKPREVIRQLSKEEGLKSICERIRYAFKLAEKQNRSQATWTDFITAHLTILAESQEENDWR